MNSNGFSDTKIIGESELSFYFFIFILEMVPELLWREWRVVVLPPVTRLWRKKILNPRDRFPFFGVAATLFFLRVPRASLLLFYFILFFSIRKRSSLSSIWFADPLSRDMHIGYDHNWSSAASYPVQLIQDAASAFDGVSFHCYAVSFFYYFINFTLFRSFFPPWG